MYGNGDDIIEPTNHQGTKIKFSGMQNFCKTFIEYRKGFKVECTLVRLTLKSLRNLVKSEFLEHSMGMGTVLRIIGSILEKFYRIIV